MNNALIHNRFDIVVRDAKTEEVIEKHTGYNIILNTFWAQFLRVGNTTTLSNLQYGSGTAAPVATDTALGNRIGGKAVTDIATDFTTIASNRTIKRTCKIRIEASENNGTTISEVGMATGTSSGLVTKSLIKDQNGNPLQIAKTDTVIIDIYSTFFVVVPETLISGTMKIHPNSNFLNWLVCNATLTASASFRQSKLSSYGVTVLSASPSYSATPSYSFDTSNLKIVATLPNIAAGSGNIVGIESLECPPGIETIYPNSATPTPLIVKEVVGVGDGVTTKFGTKFGRIMNDGNAKAFVNDVETAAAFGYGKFGKSQNIGHLIEFAALNNYYWFKAPDGVPITRIKNTYTSSLNIYISATVKSSYDVTQAIAAGATYEVPAQYQTGCFFSATASASGQNNLQFYGDSWDVEFSSPPPNGATVAVTYKTNCIPKSEESVFNNISVSLTFAEYTP